MPVVHISLIQGRGKEAKKAGAPKESVTVVFHDIDGDSWAAGGVLFSDRVKK
ncbi:MAG: tautomerase family protein [Candidatus Tectomicrobia bacterium]|nr:tautomerase family protein [Candidatus Tectomicrobia bacterium]